VAFDYLLSVSLSPDEKTISHRLVTNFSHSHLHFDQVVEFGRLLVHTGSLDSRNPDAELVLNKIEVEPNGSIEGLLGSLEVSEVVREVNNVGCVGIDPTDSYGVTKGANKLHLQRRYAALLF
jgi:hypothetical protein